MNWSIFTWSFEAVEPALPSRGNLLQQVSEFPVVSIALFVKTESSYCMTGGRWSVAIVDHMNTDISLSNIFTNKTTNFSLQN